MIKIILSDIDGTFLKNDKTPTELTAKAAKSVVAQGLKFVFVSARMPEAIYPITDAIAMAHTPVISYGGGLVLTEDEQIIFDKKISLDDAKNILAVMKESWQDISVNYYAGRRWFVESVDERIEHEIKITKATAQIHSFDNLLAENILPNKIMIICNPPTCKDMESQLGKKFPALNVVRSAPHLLEITDKSISKATGIEILLKHYGFTLDDAIAFGDNYNDVEMLQLIPQSVAMGNAPDDVKKLAHAVTDSNEDSGIYTYLVKIGVIKP
ncbi:MAG: Cof-type HAD-IIB family hydrolase [Selenomonadaceae bacterium]|nr:Cof-type HAD-IIB family hydrolase [Selenomonadaceae bacterium]